MNGDGRRRTALTWTAVGLLGVLAADRLILRPGARAWSAQGQRIAALREEVVRGRRAAERIETLRARWKEAVSRSLPLDAATAEERLIRAVGGWARDSRVALTAVTPRWRKETGGFSVLECRLAAEGEWLALARFLDAIEHAPFAIRLEQMDLAPRDERGVRLNLTLRFSALQISEGDRSPSP
jgi:hypothetical protein